jgi:N-acetylneuraminate synthase
LAEIQDAVTTARSTLACGEIILPHCASSYPAVFEDANLATIPHLASAFDVVAGLSDHTPGSAAPAAAVALGACVIEKHSALARADGGPDAAFSLEPAEFRSLVEDCRNAWRAVGRVTYDIEGSEKANIVFRRSLYAGARRSRKGEAFTKANVRVDPAGVRALRRSTCRVCSATGRRGMWLYGEPIAEDMLGVEGGWPPSAQLLPP